MSTWEGEKNMIHVEPYLERIGVRLEPGRLPGGHSFGKPVSGLAGLDLLKLLIHRHVRQVPFENMTVMRGVPISTEADKLYEKIVVRRQGGVCFELNGLFHALLRRLGFEADLAGASPYNSETGLLREPDTHMFNLVRIGEQPYVVDVGFGGHSPGVPVPMNGEPVEDVDGLYRVVEMENWHYLQKKEEDDWRHLYRFQPEARQLESFEPKIRYIERSPESTFNKRLFFSVVTDAGRVTLAKRSLTVVEHRVKTKRELAEHEVADAVRRYFGLELPADLAP